MQQINAEIVVLETQIAENKNLSDLALIELKAVFAKYLAKLKSKPDNVPENAKPVENSPQSKLNREVFIATPGHVPTGNQYSSSDKPIYDNPITAIHYVGNTNARMKFELKNG